MKKIDNIEQFDDLLKQQFDSFAPEPPAEVWQSLSQQPTIGNTSTASKFVSAVKSVSIVSKGIIALAVIVASATSIILLQKNKPKQVKNSSIITPPKLEGIVKIDNGLKVFEASPVNASISNSNSDKKVQGEMPIVEKNTTDFVETDKGLKPSSPEIHELRTDVKPLETETQQGQIQVEKVIVKTPTVENISGKEPEVVTQTPAFADIDTLIAPEIPNTFTPGDDDNLNKEFVIKLDNESTYRLRVFDLKANLVFESFRKEIHWNGQHFKSGENCESGKYFYIFDYQYKGAKELRQKSGYILLSR